MATKVLSIAQVTFKSYIRSKVVYGLCGIVLLYLLTLTLILFENRAINGSTQFETNFVSISCEMFSFVFLFVSVISSAYLITKEIKERTIIFVLTKPLDSLKYIVGKWMGVCFFLLFTTFLFALPFHIIGLIFFKKFYIYQDFFFATMFIAMSMLSAFVMMLSLKTTPVPAIVFPILFSTKWIGQLINGLSNTEPSGQLLVIGKQIGLPFLYVLYYILPSFEEVTLYPSDIVWGKEFFINYLFTLAYAADITLIYLLVCVYLFNRNKKLLVGSVT